MSHKLSKFVHPPKAAQYVPFYLQSKKEIGIATQALIHRRKRSAQVVQVIERHTLIGPCTWIFGVEFDGASSAAQTIREALLYNLLPAAIDPC